VTRVLTVLPAMPLPATAGLSLRMVEELQIVRALGCHSTVLAFQTEDDDPGAERLSTLCDEAIAGGQRVPYQVFSAAERAQQHLQFVYNALRHRRGDIYPLSVRYDRMGAKDVVADAVARTKPDFVILPSFLSHYAPVVAGAGCGTVIDAADVLRDLTRAFVRLMTRTNCVDDAADRGATDLDDALAELGNGDRFGSSDVETAPRRMAEMQIDELDGVLHVPRLHQRRAESDTGERSGKWGARWRRGMLGKSPGAIGSGTPIGCVGGGGTTAAPT